MVALIITVDMLLVMLLGAVPRAAPVTRAVRPARPWTQAGSGLGTVTGRTWALM